MPYTVDTLEEKRVADYLRISMADIQEMDIVDYMIARRDAFIYMKAQTEEGREYLRNADRLNITTPDRESLRQKFGKKER
ncbi:MAG: hypothetical protein IJZ96_08570 [Lachnospiraceae bacterium]|nr:hypothetical protein [Lachnospiraceae bacterium]